MHSPEKIDQWQESKDENNPITDKKSCKEILMQLWEQYLSVSKEETIKFRFIFHFKKADKKFINFLIYKEIQKGSGAKSYMTKSNGLLICD